MSAPSGDRGPGETGRAALGADLVLPAMAVGLVAYFFVSVADLNWEAKANAMVIGTALLALIALHVARVALRVWAGDASLSLSPLFEPRRTQLPRLLVVALTAMFVLLIPWLGVTLGLFLLTVSLMLVLGAGSLRRILGIAAVIALAAYLLFVALLNSRLPRGPFEHLIALLLGR